MNNASILPPAYDCHNQQMLIRPATPSLLPPPPPPDLPEQLSEQSSNYNNNKHKIERLQQYDKQNSDKQQQHNRYITDETINNNSNV